MKNKPEIDPRLLDELTAIRTVPERNPAAAQSGRQAFLRQAQEMAAAGVSPAPRERHNGWISKIRSVLFAKRKEKTLMFNALASLILIISLVLGGGGVTAAAAQGSLPDDPLYQVKLWGEDIRLWLAVDPQDKIDLLMTYTNRRAEEIQSMVQAGNTPPEAVLARYQHQVEQTIRWAGELPVADAGPALEKIRTGLQNQEQAMQQFQANNPGLADSLMEQTRQMLRDRLGWVDEGLAAPDLLKVQIQQRDRDQVNKPTREPQSTQDSRSTGNGNPWASGTPTPGGGTGPGPGPNPSATCTPGTGPGPQPTSPGPGPQPTSPGPGPQPTSQPTGTGPGPQVTPPGPQPTNQPIDPGNPGGNH